MTHRPLPPSSRRGVSLVEALVALAVMGFGMLALVGVQGTMRLNSDLAKQRSEATRIASEEIERLRSFRSVTPVQDQPGVSYDEIVDRTVEAYTPPNAIGNATYRVERSVSRVADMPRMVLTVRVSWIDRTNILQTVTLDSAISRTPPALGALLAVQTTGSPATRRSGRHVSIPVNALDLGTGTSRFEPPGANNVAWYFNNLSGEMRVCNAAGDGCEAATLVSGAVRYHGSAIQPTAENARNPLGPAMNLAAGPNALALVSPIAAGTQARCYADSHAAADLAARSSIAYFCAVIPETALGWGGQINPRPVDGAGVLATFAADGAAYKSCRYTTGASADPNGNLTVNADHPKAYCQERPGAVTAAAPCAGRRVTTNLINQHFLVIRGNLSCPADDATPLRIDRNTRQHQP